MKKISKAVSKNNLKRFQKSDTLFTKDIISIDDQKNKKYLDNFAYQLYLNNESSDFYEE